MSRYVTECHIRRKKGIKNYFVFSQDMVYWQTAKKQEGKDADMEYSTSFGSTSFGSDGGNSMMTIFIVIFAVILAAIIGYRLYIWNKNNHSPRENGKAKVVTKRIKVVGMGGHRINTNVMNDMTGTTRTRYFVTFELESGKRLEFNVNDGEYGMLAEGDSGELTWQGTRYLGFERT